MIVSCPSCGTHYKHQAPAHRARARCGACASTIDLSTLRPYRIVTVRSADREAMRRAASHLPIGLDDPGLASEIAANVGDLPARPLTPAVSWDESEALPAIPEMMTVPDASDLSVPAEDEGEALAADGDAEAAAPRTESRLTIVAFWAAGGAIVGTGTSWTLGGTTVMGIVAGAAVGAIAATGWLLWTSRQ